MKKYFLMLVLMFTMSIYSFAEGNDATKIEKIEKYDLKVNLRRLSTVLDLNADQIEPFKFVEDEFQKDLMFIATECNDENRKAVTTNAIEKHIKHMHYFLNDKQFKTYLVLLNATVNNRELLK